jgi:hypothetical protein
MGLPMKHSCFALLGAALAVSGLAVPGAAKEKGMEEAAGTNQAAASPSKLQVTGTVERFTVDADHADVQSLLKAIFDQAKKQFNPGHNVTGQVTLRLTDQPLDKVLNAVCEQMFLRYHPDKTDGIYRFEQDDAAIKAAFIRLNTLNAQLRQQLRDMGLDVPGDEQLSITPGAIGGFGGGGVARNGAALGNGARGGAGTQSPAQGSAVTGQPGGQNGIRERYDGDQRSAAKAGLGGVDSARVDTKGAQGPLGSQGPAKRDSGHATRLQGDYVNPADALQMLNGANGRPFNADAYQQFLKQNNFVAYNTNSQEIPIADMLQQLGQQAGVQILIDPSVPRGRAFRIDLVLTPRPLPEALNILTRSALLEWRWIGNRIFVTTTPSFKIFYGNMQVPQVIYGVPPGYTLQRASQGYGNSQAVPNGDDKQDGAKNRGGGK